MSDNDDFSDVFFIDQEQFETQILPACEEVRISPRTVAQFLIRLPFHLPVPQDTLISMYVDADTLYSFLFSEELSYE